MPDYSGMGTGNYSTPDDAPQPSGSSSNSGWGNMSNWTGIFQTAVGGAFGLGNTAIATQNGSALPPGTVVYQQNPNSGNTMMYVGIAALFLFLGLIALIAFKSKSKSA